MANLANGKRFTKHFLSTLLAIQLANQIAKLCFKTKHHIVILKIDNKFYRLDSSSQLASATLIKLLSYFCCIMVQPAPTQQTANKLSNQHQLAIGLNKIPMFYRYPQSVTTNLCPSHHSITIVSYIHLQSHMVRPQEHDHLQYKARGGYIASDNTPARKQGLAM